MHQAIALRFLLDSSVSWGTAGREPEALREPGTCARPQARRGPRGEGRTPPSETLARPLQALTKKAERWRGRLPPRYPMHTRSIRIRSSKHTYLVRCDRFSSPGSKISIGPPLPLPDKAHFVQRGKRRRARGAAHRPAVPEQRRRGPEEVPGEARVPLPAPQHAAARKRQRARRLCVPDLRTRLNKIE